MPNFKYAIFFLLELYEILKILQESSIEFEDHPVYIQLLSRLFIIVTGKINILCFNENLKNRVYSGIRGQGIMNEILPPLMEII